MTNKPGGGFTLVEVAMAVAILATGFATLTVIQGRSIDSARTEHNRVVAILSAQYILTSYLTQPKTLATLSDRSGDLVTELKTLGYFEGDRAKVNEAQFRGFTQQLSVSPINYGELQGVLLKLESKVSWDGDFNHGVSVSQLVIPPKATTSIVQPTS